MDKENQTSKICRACGHEREYDTYHRLYVACKKCASIRCAKYYQTNREKILERSRLYRENNEDRYKRNRKTIDTHRRYTDSLQSDYYVNSNDENYSFNFIIIFILLYVYLCICIYEYNL